MTALPARRWGLLLLVILAVAAVPAIAEADLLNYAATNPTIIATGGTFQYRACAQASDTCFSSNTQWTDFAVTGRVSLTGLGIDIPASTLDHDPYLYYWLMLNIDSTGALHDWSTVAVAYKNSVNQTEELFGGRIEEFGFTLDGGMLTFQGRAYLTTGILSSQFPNSVGPAFPDMLVTGYVRGFPGFSDSGELFTEENVSVTHSAIVSATVPEPATITLLGLGLLGAVRATRRRR